MARGGILAAAAALLMAAAPATAAIDELILASRSSSGASGTGPSTHPAVASDNRHVAFQTEAANLASGGGAGTAIVLRDMVSGTTALVSRADGVAGAGAADDSLAPSISDDGRYVAFESDADNLSAEDDNNVRNIFVRDTVGGTTTLVSRATGPGGDAADGHSYAPSISGDGRHVAFHSAADNLSANDENNVFNIFVRDLQTGTTELVSRASGQDGHHATGNSYAPSVSGDGRHIAFQSDAHNLDPEANPIVRNVFVRDRSLATTRLVSRADGEGGAGADADATQASISGDGSAVAFVSGARNLSSHDSDSTDDVFVRFPASGSTVLASRAEGPDGLAADRDSFGPSLDRTGRRVAFQSTADNLSSADTRYVTDVFLRDLDDGRVWLMSRASGANGVGGDATSAQASLSSDGRFVAFDSLAENLSPVAGEHADIFVRDVLGPPPEPPPPPPVPQPVGPAGGPGTVLAAGPEASGGTPAGPARSRSAAPRCAGRVATIVGTQAADTLRGTPGPDVISAGAGNDRVFGLAGDDIICLGAGADRAVGGRGDDRILGHGGRDRILGQRGEDRLDGGRGADSLLGGPGDDALLGRRGNDRLVGGRGDDGLTGHRGDDRLAGGSGRDLLRGGAGRDNLIGGPGDDLLYGWTGRDTLGGGPGRDLAVGGAGRDRCRHAVRRGCER